MPQKCSGCGAEIPEGSKLGACPKCLLSVGLDAGAQVASGPEPEVGDRIGPYKLLEKLGEGGCGLVYMAEQQEPIRRRVALKLIKPGMDSREVIARFEVEGQALALMDHPNIARIFDANTTESGRPYFVMELVRGIRVTDYCDRHNLSTRERLDLFVLISHAVQHAHQKGIIHRDLKPSNILVTVNDGVPVPKIIDFGIAKATQQALTDKTLFTRFNQLLGTPAYMSPEQAELTSLDIDTRTDIYSLGVLLYELLTGRTPFDSKELLKAGLEQMLRIIREREPTRPSASLSTLTAEELTTIASRRQIAGTALLRLFRGDLDWIVMKCLEKDRTRRYETSNALAADIQRHLENEPVLAGRPSNLYRLQKTVRRHRLAFAAAAAVLVSLLLGLGTTTVMFLKEQAARHSANAARAEVVRQNAELELMKSEVERKNAEFRAMLAEAARSDRFVAEDKLRLGQEQFAFAHLARACEYDPSSALAAEMAIAAVASWNHERPISILAGHTNGVKSARFSPDGTRIVTASDDNTACMWDVATGRMLATLSGHTGKVSSVEFSPDGTRIVTGSYDKTARLWDSATGATLATLAGHTNLVTSAQFNPDGTRIVTVSSDKTVRVWDTRSGNALATLSGYTNMCITSQFSPDGTTIVTAGDGIAFVWDVVTGETLATLAGHTRSLRGAWFSPDGTRIVTASVDKTARVWDAQSGNMLLKLVGHEGPQWGVEHAQFSPDGTRIVTAGRDDKTARVWEASTGKLLKTLIGHKGEVSRVQFNPDGDRIVSMSWSPSDSTARVWDASTGKALATLAGHQAGVWSAQFSPDGEHLVTASDDKTVRIWQAATLRMTLAKPFGRPAFSPDGKRVATMSNDKAVRVWDLATGKALATLAEQNEKVSSAQFNPNGTRIITRSREGPARLWDAATGTTLRTLGGSTDVVHIAEFSPDGTRIVTASGTELAHLWEPSTGGMLATLAGHMGAVRFVQFSPDSKRIVTAGRDDKTARVWEAETGKLLRTLANKGEVSSAQFSPDGTRIFTTAANEPVQVWDTTAGNSLATLGDRAWMTRAQFSPDGTRMLTVSSERGASVSNSTGRIVRWQTASGQIRLWDLATGQLPVTLIENTGRFGASAEFGLDGTRIITTMANEPPRLWHATTGKALATLGHRSGAVTSATFSPDGRRIITAPGIVRNPGGAIAELWDSATGEALAKLTGHTGVIGSALFSSDGTRIVTSSDDGTVRVWDSTTGEQSAILTVNEAVAQADKDLATLGGYDARLRSAQFSPDGARVFITSGNGAVLVWDVMPKDAGPPPEWFRDFLRYMAQARLNSDGELETLKTADWLALQERLRGVLRASPNADTPYLHVLRKYVRE